MNKKSTLLLLFFIISVFVKAQITSVSYPSGYLSEKRISEMLENSRKRGMKESEIQKESQLLHLSLKKQNDAIANGTYNNNIGQKTIQPPPILAAGCNNPGFETGTTAGWTFTQASASGATLPCPTCFTGVAGGVFEVTTAGATSTANTNAGNNTGGDASATCDCSNTNTNDCTPEPYTGGFDRFGGFSVVAPAPLGGTHSLMLNNSNCGYLMQKASQIFPVNASDVSFTFQYAIVLQDGGHPLSEAPYFFVNVTDVATGTVVPCTQYTASAEGATSGNLNGWTASAVDPSVFWYPWTTVTLNLTSMIGRNANISFTISDCSQGGHFGYAYIDASCNPLQITRLVPLCPGQNAVLSGPPGMASYSWLPGGATTQNLTTATVGNYTLNTTSATGCPSPTLYYNLTQDPNPVPSFTTSSPPCTGGVTFTDGSTIAAPDTITNWVWNYGDGTPPVNSTTDANQTHAYAAPGTYTVTLTDTTNNHCVASYSFVVTTGAGGPVPSFSSNSPATAPQCLTGNNVVFTNASTATGGAVITGYVWDYGDGSPTVTSTTTTPNPPNHTYTATGTYVVTLTVNVTGCSSTTTQTVVIIPEPTASFSAPPVCLGNATVFTSTITNANTYSWTFGDGNTSTTSATPSNTYATPGTFVVNLTVTAVGGCSVTATNSVIVSPLPTASFTVGPVCLGTPSFFDASASTPAVGGTYSWSFGGGAPNTDIVTVQTDNHTYLASGTFPVSLTVSVGTCSATATGNAVVSPMPVLTITTTPACDLSPVIITNNTLAQGTFTVWSWTFGDGIGTSAVAAPGSYTYPAPGIYTVTLTASTATGCSGTVTTTAIVHPNPVADGSITFACLGTASTFSSTSFVTNPAGINDVITTSSWSFGDGSSSPLPSTTHTYATCGSYSVSLTVTTNFNCTDAVGTLDTVFCLPVVTAPPSFKICPGTPVTIAQTTFTATCQQPELAPPITLLFINNPNVSNHNTTSVHGGIPLADTLGVDSIPNYTAIAQNLTCGLLIDTIYGIALTPISNTIYCVGNEATFTISVYPTPTVTPVNDVTVCANATVPAVNFTGCPTPETFSWTTTTNPNTVNTGIAAIGSGDIGTFNGTNTTSAAAITTVSVTPWANGCQGIPTNFNITVNPLPTLTAIGATVCPSIAGSPITVPSPTITTNPANPAAGVTYSWTATNSTNTGMPAAGVGTPAAYTAPANSTLTNQISIVTYTPSLAGCIGLPATDTINIKPTPFVGHVPSSSYCPNQLTAPVNFICFPPSGTPVFTWQGLAGIGGTQTGNIAPFVTVNNSNVSVVATVSVNATLNGCPGPDSTFQITVFPNPTASFVAAPACDGSPTYFTNTSTAGGGFSVSSYTWNFGAGQTSTAQNPSQIISPVGWDPVQLSVSTNSAPSCTATVTDSVLVNPNPVASLLGHNLKGCPIINTTFTDQSTPVGSITSWNWSFPGNINQPPATTFSGQFPPSQNYGNTSNTMPKYYSVSLTVATAAGCTSSVTKNNYIEVYPTPVADFSWGPTDADIDNPVITFVNQATGYAPYSGSTNPAIYEYGPYGVEYNINDPYSSTTNIIDNNTSFTHSYNYLDPNDVYETYPVTQWVVNSYGCVDSITKVVEIKPIFTFYIPNAFTPNGDGKNEGFKGIGEGIDNTTYNMWIFDRWGLMIYYTTDINQVWDGHMHGDEGKPVLQEDVYVWKVQFNDIFGAQHQYHGTVTLVK